jgi:DNA invertase Pin-like site-specific DNA recombinase
MRNVVAYCRTARALDSDPIACVREQAEAIHRYAKANGYLVHETYMDAGVSGVTTDRPALQELLADCEAGKVGVVLVQDADRLSRDTGNLIAVLTKFRENVVRVEFSTKGGEDQFCFVEALVAALAELGGSPLEEHLV